MSDNQMIMNNRNSFNSEFILNKFLVQTLVYNFFFN